MEEGYIKFKRTKVDDIPVPAEHLTEITPLRDELYKLGLIGQYPDIRYEPDALFVITGSKTGGLETLTDQHYARVLKVDVDTNRVWYGGPIEASSESMTHRIVYLMDSTTNAVIHVHNLALWERLLNKVPTTLETVEYGTPEMARETVRLFNETDVKEKKILVMAGHKEGILSFGKDLNEAREVLLKYFNNQQQI
jgi:L-ribulose-5-phosphate 4-epimerase